MDLVKDFFVAYMNWSESWVNWQLTPGSLKREQYEDVESRFKVKFPPSFIAWHQSHFFHECDCSLIRLPGSDSNQPLNAIIKELDWFIPEKLIPQKLYPFGSEGNDMGPLVFDARFEVENNEFPIRAYDHEFMGSPDGLTDIIFSSFTKLLECMTHYLTEIKTRQCFDIIPEFFNIDAKGAGKPGLGYWLGWSGMQRANFEEFGY
jgi:hypothetical protein